MIPIRLRPRPGPPLAALALALACLAGCSGREAPAVDAEQARQAVRTALDAWSKGAAIGSLRDQKPSITAQDLDWEMGAALRQYEVLGPGEGGSANLRVPVELTLQDKSGRTARKKVTYMVGTSPSITVFREIF